MFNRNKLSRGARIIFSPQRWTEIIWRMTFRAFYSRRILRTLERAYASRCSPEAFALRRDSEVAWGFAAGAVAKARGYIYVVHQLQAKLRGTKWLLGRTRIGFDDLEICARAGDANSSRVYLGGFDESVTLFDVYRKRAVSGTAAIDVGANIGIHTLVLSRCVGESGRVYSYEPNQDLCERLRENVMLNGIANVTLRNRGAAAADCMLRFQSRQEEFNLGLGRFDKTGSIEVPVVRLDSDLHFDGKISLIKIDVEGMELDVIRGARQLIMEHQPALVLECNRKWTLNELRDHIPYTVTISSIPETLLDRPRNLDGVARYHDSQNILVEPYGLNIRNDAPGRDDSGHAAANSRRNRTNGKRC
jgi:FkbM family methyltransferase